VRNQGPFIVVLCLCITLAIFTGCGSVSGSSTVQPTSSPSPTASPNPSPSPSASPTPSPSPSPSPTPSGAASRFIYGITVFETDIGYEGGSVNNATGKVTPLAPFNNAGLGQNIVPQLISDPAGRFLYALNLGASSFGITLGNPGIAELAINQQTGALSAIPGSPLVFPDSRPGMLAITPAGTLLFQPDAGVFDVYSINPGSGLLTKVSSSTAASVGNFTAISPDGRFLFNSGDGNVEALSIGSGGNLTVVQSPIPTGGSAPGVVGQLAVSPDSKLLYVLNQGNIAIFNIGSTGTLTPVVGSPFTTAASAAGFALTPDGKHLYVNFQSSTNTVQGFTFDPVASTLTPIPNAAVTNAISVTVDGSGKFAYITQPPSLTTFAIDPTTGGLTQVSQAPQPLSDSPQSIVAVR